ncbi:hypothetical protein BDP27DRAFT_1502459 [Rhodocollybia butyracea]|uniref:Uncharacterized protein n=1 Tax=Rhodocollybia butyracea TaxID=206335 RepID=A0A9P5TZ70_9AGAR|nr:hypothetical protein BDP27DRAFT_1502459 [Rhodocollybia butyracea]
MAPKLATPQEKREFLLAAIQTLRDDPLLKETFETKYSEKLKEVTMQTMEDDLSQISDILVGIQKEFTNVSGTLRRFDRGGYRKKKADGSSGGESIRPLETEWAAFRTRFDQLLASSRETANNASAQATHYETVILKLVMNAGEKDDKKDILTELDDFIKGVREFEEASKTFGTEIDDLRNEIKLFEVDMDIAINDATAENQQEIEEVKNCIKNVETEIGRYQTTATVGWISLGVGAVTGVATGAVVGGGVALGLLAMTPVGWVVAGGVAIAAGIAFIGGIVAGIIGEIKKAKSESERVELNKQLKALEAKKKELETLKVLFTKAEGEIDELYEHLGVVISIWRIFDNEAVKLKTSLKKIQTTESYAVLRQTVLNAQAEFEILRQHLDKYATQVDTRTKKRVRAT